jgi:hypothetical protein
MRGLRHYDDSKPYLRKGDTAFVVALSRGYVKIIECEVKNISWHWRKYPWTRGYFCYYWVRPKSPLRGRDKKFSYFFGCDMGIGDCLFKHKWQAREAAISQKMLLMRLDTSTDYVILQDDEW